jgi:hypothetical protein
MGTTKCKTVNTMPWEQQSAKQQSTLCHGNKKVQTTANTMSWEQQSAKLTQVSGSVAHHHEWHIQYTAEITELLSSKLLPLS